MFSIHGDPLAKIGSQQSGGQNVYVYELSRWLAKRNWQVDIFCRLDNSKNETVKKIGNKIKVIRLKAGEIKYLPKENFFENFVEFFTNFLNYRQENKIDYDIVHGHYWDGGMVAMKAAETLSLPFVQVFHSLSHVRYNALKKFQNLLDDSQQKDFERRFNLEKQIIEKANKIIAESPYEEDDLMQYYGTPREKIVICPAGVDTKRFSIKDKDKAKEKLKIDKETKVILYVGRLEWRKGIGTLIVGASHFIKKQIDQNFLLLIVGGDFSKHGNSEDQAEYNHLKKVVGEQGVDNFVRFEGSISQHRINNYYNAADVVVVPSYYEPFGIVPLEAMATKVPVIASATGGLQYTVLNSETGLLITPHDPLDLAGKLEIMFNEPELKERIVANAYERVIKNFNWPIITKNIDHLYYNLIKENSHEL